MESHYSLKEGTYFHVHILKKLQLIIIYVYRKGKKPKNFFVEGGWSIQWYKKHTCGNYGWWNGSKE